MHFAVRGEHVRAVDVAITRPIREHAAGFFDQHAQSRNVPWLDAVFRHDFTRTLCDQNETVEVAEAALSLGESRKLQELISLAGFDEPRKTGIKHDRFRQTLDV